MALPVTIDDVLYSGICKALIRRHPRSGGSLASGGRGTRDEQTVRFVLNQPLHLSGLHVDWSAAGAHLARQSRLLSWRPIQPMRCRWAIRPMKVVEVAADHIRLEPNEYDTSSTPYISALEFRFYPDYPSIYAAYSKGELDGISRILPDDLALARDREDLQLFSSIESVYVSVIFNLNSPTVSFLQEKAVRHALYYALDRQKLVSEAATGQGVVATSPIPAGNWAYTGDVRQYPYDLVTANRLLDEAGWVDSNGNGIRDKDGQELSFILLGNDDPVR
ncbi:MAG: ABC transporter substrate-binding protein [Caldilineaceae bacterium]